MSGLIGSINSNSKTGVIGGATTGIQYHFVNSGEDFAGGDHYDLQANISGTQASDIGFYVFALNRYGNDGVFSLTLPTGWTTENSLVMGFMNNDSTYQYKQGGSECYMTTANPAVLKFTTSSYWRNFRVVVWKYK